MRPDEHDQAKADELTRIQPLMRRDVPVGLWRSYWCRQFEDAALRRLPFGDCLREATRATMNEYGVPELQQLADMIVREWNLDPDRLDQGIRWRAYFLRMRPQYEAARRRAYNRTVRYINGCLKHGKDRRWRRFTN